MRTGVSYMGHHNPRHLETDLAEMQALQLDDVFLCLQENDFHYFPGKVTFPPSLAAEHGLRPLAIFWGALNLFGGGRSSQFLLEHQNGFQVDRQGNRLAAGCYVNSDCVAHIQSLIDRIAEAGYAGYFIDEPTPLRNCFCDACQAQYRDWYQADLRDASPSRQEAFRRRCVIHYVDTISTYCGRVHPQLETLCCLMLEDKALWQEAARLPHLQNLGTDIYWVNQDTPVEQMAPHVQEMAALCADHGKVHHQWLECWRAKAGREARIGAMGRVLVRERPDALYVWAWHGQIGTAESCADPQSAWAQAVQILREAKEEA